MAKTKISEFSTTAGNNTDINSINIAEGCAPSGINDAIRELMRQLKEFQTGGAGDSVNSGGDFSVATNKFTVASASGNTAVAGTLGVTGAATLSSTLAVTGTTTLTGALVANGNATLGDGSGDTVTVKGTPTLEVNPTLSGGTANGVAYLNGSKVLTTGSALTFDGSNFATTGSGTLKNLLLSGGTLPGAGNPSIALRSSDNVVYHQSGSANNIVMLDSAQNTMQSIGATAQTWNISNSEQMRLTSTGLGIGTSSPATKLDVVGTGKFTAQQSLILNGATGTFSTWQYNGTAVGDIGTGNQVISGGSTGDFALTSRSGNLVFGTGTVERMRLDSSGNLLVGRTSSIGSARVSAETSTGTPTYAAYLPTTGTETAFLFVNPNGTVGSITTNGSATTYATSSDYRLKNITGPITTSGAYIDSLNPVEGTWKADGSTFVGLIAHEVQEASRTTVATGVKDGDEMQGMDYSSAEIIANLIAEVKSLRQRLAAAGI